MVRIQQSDVVVIEKSKASSKYWQANRLFAIGIIYLYHSEIRGTSIDISCNGKRSNSPKTGFSFIIISKSFKVLV